MLFFIAYYFEVETFFQGWFYFYGIEMVKWFLQGIHAAFWDIHGFLYLNDVGVRNEIVEVHKLNFLFR